MPDTHCTHCEPHEAAIKSLQAAEVVRGKQEYLRDVTVSILRWMIPIVVTATGIYVAVVK